MSEDLKALISDKRKAVDREKWSQAASLCNCIGSELERQGQFQKALESHQEELRYLEIVDDEIGMGVANRRIGECYAFMNEYERAFKHVKIYLETAKSMEDKVEQQRAWTTLGRIYYMKSSYEKDQEMPFSNSLERSERAYVTALSLLNEINESKEKPEMRAGLLLNLGLVFDSKEDLQRCAESIAEAMLLAHKFDLYEMLHRCEISLASVYHKRGKLKNALPLYEKSINSAQKLRDKLLLCESLHSKALLLIELKDFQGAKKALKRAYKTHSPNNEDHNKITQNLKVCIGLCTTQAKLQNLEGNNAHEQKVLLEKMADALASLNLYKLSIEYYLLTLEHMKKYSYSSQEKAPIYFSIAATYRDDGNLNKALEYLQIELECNEDRPKEKVNSLWKMAEYFEELKDATKEEEILLQALATAEGIQDLLASSLQKLCMFYKRNGEKDKHLNMKTRLKSLPPQESTEESEPEEDTQDIFSDIRLSEMSQSDEEPEKGYLRARKRRKPTQRVNEKGESALHQACINNNLTVVKRLVDSGCDINTRDHCGWTPLHEACNYGFYDVAEYLIDHGADIHDRGGEGCEGITPLHDAAICGHMNIMKMLISKGASVTVCDNRGRSPLETLIRWKTESEVNGHFLDSETLSLYHDTVDQLKTLMTQAGQPPKLDFLENTSTQQNDANLCEQKPQRLSKASEKRVISESSSDSMPEEESPAEDSYKIASDNLDWDDADQAQAEYKCVMTSLRKSAQTVIPEKKIEPPQEPKEALINECEYVDNWLLKDTNQPPRVQKKRRKKRRLNVRTSKCIDSYLTTNDDSQHSTESDVVSINEDFTDEPMIVSEVNPVVTHTSSTASNIPNPITTVSTPVNQVTRNITLRVRIEDKLILVPVPDDACLVSWLAKEAAERYQDLVGSKLHLTLMTKDGALLSSTDPVMKLFSNNDEVLTSVECFEEPSLVERYEKVCLKRKIKPMMSLKGYLKPFDTCKKLNLSGVPLPKIQIAPIFASLLQFKNIQSLDISESVIGDECSSHVINCFPSFVSLVSLSMRCCGLSSKTLKSMADYIWSRNSDTLPNLKELNLSYNKFNSNCGYYLSSLLTLPSLIELDLGSCDLSPSIFLDDSLCRALQSCTRLEKFVISGNAQYGSGVDAYLKHLPKTNLSKLDLSHVLLENLHFGDQLSAFLSSGVPALRELSLQECRLKSHDLLALQSALHHCPFLTSVNLSYNPDLTSWDVCSFIQFLVSYTVVREMHAVQTCEWDESSIVTLAQALSKRNLKYVSLDNVTEPSQDVLMQTWDSAWGIPAKSLALGFCELRIS